MKFHFALRATHRLLYCEQTFRSSPLSISSAAAVHSLFIFTQIVIKMRTFVMLNSDRRRTTIYWSVRHFIIVSLVFTNACTSNQTCKCACSSRHFQFHFHVLRLSRFLLCFYRSIAIGKCNAKIKQLEFPRRPKVNICALKCRWINCRRWSEKYQVFSHLLFLRMKNKRRRGSKTKCNRTNAVEKHSSSDNQNARQWQKAENVE